jgi:ribonuclease VapC
MRDLAESPTSVLDASALLALFQGEPGGDIVQKLVKTSVMSSVNWSEVIQKSLNRQADVQGLRGELEALGFRIIPFSAEQAETTARLRSLTRLVGLALRDRACLALACELHLPAVTADGGWKGLDVGVEIQLIR